MNKLDLINKLSAVVSTKKEAEQVLGTIINNIKSALKLNERVVISGFGSFTVYIRKAKKLRNPRTGELMKIMPRKVVRFRPAKKFL